mmetsp:Transcript_80612/g.155715  ORF Transcript_80612/g.155715 Transcript_80612/m.155715 type:complete len:216 (-) Transcript_80612:283-930(-)
MMLPLQFHSTRPKVPPLPQRQRHHRLCRLLHMPQIPRKKYLVVLARYVPLTRKKLFQKSQLHQLLSHQLLSHQHQRQHLRHPHRHFHQPQKDQQKKTNVKSPNIPATSASFWVMVSATTAKRRSLVETLKMRSVYQLASARQNLAWVKTRKNLLVHRQSQRPHRTRAEISKTLSVHLQIHHCQHATPTKTTSHWRQSWLQNLGSFIKVCKHCRDS